MRAVPLPDFLDFLDFFDFFDFFDFQARTAL
jgi:hypothetical protein